MSSESFAQLWEVRSDLQAKRRWRNSRNQNVTVLNNIIVTLTQVFGLERAPASSTEGDSADGAERRGRNNSQEGVVLRGREIQEDILNNLIRGTYLEDDIRGLQSEFGEAFSKLMWHRLLPRLLVPEDDGELNPGPLTMSSLRFLLQRANAEVIQEEGEAGRDHPAAIEHTAATNQRIRTLREKSVVLKQNADLDTCDILTNKLEAFKTILLHPTRDHTAHKREKEALLRGRASLSPSPVVNGVPKVELHVSPQQKWTIDPVVGDTAWRNKKYIGRLGAAGYQSELFMCQMHCDLERDPLRHVAWDLLLTYFRDLLNGDVRVDDGADDGPTFGSSSARSRPTGPNRSLDNARAAWSPEVTASFMKKFRDTRVQEYFLDQFSSQDIVEMVGNMSRRVRSQTQRDEGAWQEHISVVFKAMVASVWFSGTIQFCRQQVGPALYSDSFGGFPAGLDPTVRERQASDITTMLQSSFNWVDEEPDALPTIVYLVPSIAVELSVAGPCMTSDASTRVPYSEHSEYFGTQKIRLHAPLKRLQEEKRLLKSLRHVGRRVSVPANEERERLGKWHFYPAFGSTSREGPCGFKGMLHADTIVPNRRTIPATGAYGILDVMAPIDITPPAEDGPGGDEPTTRIAPSLSIYETTVRSYNLNGNILKKNDGYKQAMLDLVKSSVDGKSRSDKAQFLRTFGKDLEKEVSAFLRDCPDDSPIRFEDTTVVTARTGRGDTQLLSGGRMLEHVETRLGKLSRIRFNELLTFTHFDEYPELVRTLLIWWEILALLGLKELRNRGCCSYNLVNNMVLCVGTFVHVFFSTQRRLTKDDSMAAYFRGSAGQDIRKSFKVLGMCSLPLNLVLARWDPRQGTVGLSRRGAGIVSSSQCGFLVTDLMIQAFNSAHGPPWGKMYELYYHGVAELLGFCPPSWLPMVLFRYMALALLMDLVAFHQFSIKVDFIKERKSSRARLCAHRLLFVKHGDTVIFDSGDAEDPRAVGLPADDIATIFVPSIMKKIWRVLEERHEMREALDIADQSVRFECQPLSGDQIDDVRIPSVKRIDGTSSEFLDQILRRLLERAMSANAQGPKRGNDTLLTAVMAAILNHMGTFIPPVGGATILTDKRGQPYCVLRDIWLAFLYKTKLPGLPRMSAKENREKKWTVQNIEYDHKRNHCEAAIERLKAFDAKFYDHVKLRRVVPNADRLPSHEQGERGDIPSSHSSSLQWHRTMAILEKMAIDGMNRHITVCFLALCKKHGASGNIDFQVSDPPTVERRTRRRQRPRATEEEDDDDIDDVPERETITDEENENE